MADVNEHWQDSEGVVHFVQRVHDLENDTFGTVTCTIDVKDPYLPDGPCITTDKPITCLACLAKMAKE